MRGVSLLLEIVSFSDKLTLLVGFCCVCLNSRFIFFIMKAPFISDKNLYFRSGCGESNMRKCLELIGGEAILLYSTFERKLSCGICVLKLDACHVAVTFTGWVSLTAICTFIGESGLSDEWERALLDTESGNCQSDTCD